MQVVSAGKDGRIKIWSHAAELQRQSDDMDCDGPMHSIAVSPDANIIAAGTDQSILVSPYISHACLLITLRMKHRYGVGVCNNVLLADLRREFDGFHTDGSYNTICSPITVFCS